MLTKKLVLASAIYEGNLSWTVRMLSPGADIKKAFSDVQLVKVHAISRMNYFKAHQLLGKCIGNWAFNYKEDVVEYTRKVMIINGY